MSVEQISTNGFQTPGGQPQPNFLPPGERVEGYVTPQTPSAPAGGITEEQVQARIAAALAAAKQPEPAPAAPAAATPVVPAGAIETNGAGDPLLNTLTAVFTSSGLDMGRALTAAMDSGDVSRIDTAYINEHGGAQAGHMLAVAQALVERVTTKANEAKVAVYEVAGGEANWNAAAAAFNAQAPAGLKQVIKGMLESGNNDTIKAASQSIVDFAKNGGLVANPAKLIGTGAAAGFAEQAMTAVEFQQAHFKLDTNARTYTADRESLLSRRRAGKAAGI